MADPTPQKRVLPARERRESAAKRQASSPIPPPKLPTPRKLTPAKSTPKSIPHNKPGRRKAVVVEVSPPRRPSTPIVEEVIPSKINDSNALPTLRQPQPDHLSIEEYKSLSESAVLAAALHRSRSRWLCDGIFERYWRKPSKKKGAPDVGANNPDPKTMQKLGPCTITIEPHTFDAILHTVRDPQAPPLVPYRHPNQYPQHPPHPPHPQYPPFYAGSPIPPQPPFQARPPPAPAPPNIKQENQTLSNQAASTPPTGPDPSKDSPAESNTATPVPHTPNPQPPAPSSPPKPNTDPVIQMLATRAAADPELKKLMKIVASSKASQEQLKLFQSHIDELNGIVERRKTDKANQEQSTRPPSSNSKPAQPPQAGGPSDLSHSPAGNPPSLPVSLPPLPPYPSQHPPPYSLPHPPYPPPSPQVSSCGGTPNQPPHPQYPHYAPPPPRSPRPEPVIKHILIEFTTPANSSVSASQDRYLFPPYAVLDSPLSGRGLEMVVSFFAVRTGSQILNQLNVTPDEEPVLAAKWKKDEEYYQPVTMTLKTGQQRVLETVARAARPLPEVQEFMNNIMKEKRRAPTEWLALRLPREEGRKSAKADARDKGEREGSFIDSGVEMDGAGEGEEEEELKDWYGIG